MKYLACALSVVALSACSTNPAPDMAAQSVIPSAERTNMQNADVNALQGITRHLIDSSSLYAAAAQDSENPAYTAQLNALSDRRRAMTNLFQARVAAMGAAPAESGDPIGTAHRVFMEARSLGNADTKVAVQEALRGENFLLTEITASANNMQLGASTRNFLNQQIAEVTADRDRLQVYASSLG
ncbi:hypothetical protein U91I_03699 [alpha proteobacterium U9-1i]|jgi:uncharacterized protein (TIGR02284 family)|nr:hypothetical protein U91I_03699 [alpha proteobacterium U9-1i]